MTSKHFIPFFTAMISLGSFVSSFAQEAPKAMSSFPAGHYSGKMFLIAEDGQQKEVATFEVISTNEGKLLQMHSESADGTEGVGLLALKFMPDGRCEDSAALPIFAAKGTCLDNTISLKQEFQNGAAGTAIYETRYQWDGNVLHYSFVVTNTHSENGNEIKTQSVTKGDLAKVQ
jgi:hypothetical protein